MIVFSGAFGTNGCRPMAWRIYDAKTEVVRRADSDGLISLPAEWFAAGSDLHPARMTDTAGRGFTDAGLPFISPGGIPTSAANFCSLRQWRLSDSSWLANYGRMWGRANPTESGEAGALYPRCVLVVLQYGVANILAGIAFSKSSTMCSTCLWFGLQRNRVEKRQLDRWVHAIHFPSQRILDMGLCRMVFAYGSIGYLNSHIGMER